MSVTITGGAILQKAVKLTTTSETDLLVATKRTTVLSIMAAEISGNTPTLTLELYDTANTTSYYIRKGKAMAANETYILNEFVIVNPGWVLRATAGAANQIDCIVNYLSPDSTALGSSPF